MATAATGVSERGPQVAIELATLGTLTPISRSGGQGRVYLPQQQISRFGAPTVVKLYKRTPPPQAASVLSQMVAWGWSLDPERWRALHGLAAWPLASVSDRGALVGILMHDMRRRFELPFLMPSGRVSNVMLQLEHLLGPDDYLRRRGLEPMLDTFVRTAIAERICAAFAFLHGSGVVVSDVSPSNLLIRVRGQAAEVAFIDCDSMLFHGQQALPSVETADWQMPAAFAERPVTPAADAYKLGLVLLRLFARSSEARDPRPHLLHVPAPLRPLLGRALSSDAASRPQASEWQLALRRLLADERLLQPHPGPPPPPRPLRRPAARMRERPPALAAAAYGMAAPRRQPPRIQPGRGAMSSRGLVLASLVLAVVMLILFLHMLQNATVTRTEGVQVVQPTTVGPGGYPQGEAEPSTPGRGEEERFGGVVER